MCPTYNSEKHIISTKKSEKDFFWFRTQKIIFEIY